MNEEKMPLDYYLEICDNIAKAGFSQVGICGGEPTDFPYLKEVVKYLHSLGLLVNLYSNLTHQEVVWSLIDYLNSLSIPLDSINYIPSMRSVGHCENVLNFLDELEEKAAPGLIVKIGTVVTSKNIDEILKVCECLKKYKILDVWKLYQYSPGGRCKSRIEEFKITEKEFLDVTSECSFENKTPKIITRTREQTKGYCVIMDPKGDFYIYDEEYIPTNKNIFRNSIEEITDMYNETENLNQKNWRSDNGNCSNAE